MREGEEREEPTASESGSTLLHLPCSFVFTKFRPGFRNQRRKHFFCSLYRCRNRFNRAATGKRSGKLGRGRGRFFRGSFSPSCFSSTAPFSAATYNFSAPESTVSEGGEERRKRGGSAFMLSAQACCALLRFRVEEGEKSCWSSFLCPPPIKHHGSLQIRGRALQEEVSTSSTPSSL